ncbi:radical SAM protein [Chengkuizengella axinellae]|uniref:Radical SAM protein n=1 Tax=Chengkuizengella axinellae TaxID=3064388 RepID=A0ABT9J0Y7_9BACL|nr:radical SAM protein [Chengkuizengella sp. 2205SS18-9]MDP5275258.1 radical SAM protein [Chengkuizengella sp. 2205SS18-9]
MNNSALDISVLGKYLSDRSQEFIIFPTEKCNFRCTYCYEDYTLGRMSKDTISGVKALFKRRASDLDNLYISWFGGEPLIADDIVLDISAYASQLIQMYPGLKYRSSMTTNGYYLTPPTFSKLTAVGVLDYQISLDGSKETHDRTRILSGGKETFDIIWENLLSIRDSSEPVTITLRVHFDSETITQIDQLIEDIKREFIHDIRFSVLFKTIDRLGGPNDDKIKVFSFEEKKIALKTLKHKLYGKDFVETEEPYVCYASRPNSLTIRADGSIGKCTVALNDSRNNIGKLNPNGTLELNEQKIAYWLRGFSTLDLATLSCPLLND